MKGIYESILRIQFGQSIESISSGIMKYPIKDIQNKEKIDVRFIKLESIIINIFF